MLTRLRSEQGFSLPELLTAMIIGLVVIFAALTVIDNAFNVNGKVANRTEAAARGRQAIDELSRTLRSQTCVNVTSGSVVSTVAPVQSASGTSLTLNTDLAGGTQPTRTTFAYDGTTDRITSSAILGSTADVNNITFTASPVTRTIATNVDPDKDAVGGAIFRYYSSDAGSGGTTYTQLAPAGGAVAAADLDRIARIDIDFVQRPPGIIASAATNLSATLSDSVVNRSILPDSATPEVTCA